MKQTPFRLLLSVVAACAALAGAAQAQSFSCPIGTEAACLDYGDQVCNSSGKCVDQNDVCFDGSQCGYSGFVCKSDLDACTQTYEALLDRFNQMVNDYNRLVSEMQSLQEARDQAEARLDMIRQCLANATTLEQARYCP